MPYDPHLLSQEGTIQWRRNVRATGHVARLLKELDLSEDTPMDEDAKEHVLHFLRRCVSYADESIQRKWSEESDDVIAQWKVYREFTAMPHPRFNVGI